MSELFDFGDEDGPNWTVKLPSGKLKCIVKGCNNTRHNLGRKNSRGESTFRKFCYSHHIGSKDVKGGFREEMEEYCENIDGRLGYRCTSNSHILEVDHIDNNHLNNVAENRQTLCNSCHDRKTAKYGSINDLQKMQEIFEHNRRTCNNPLFD